jgi:hypothetical protein
MKPMTKLNLFPTLLVALCFGCAAQPLVFPNNSLLDSLQSITDSIIPSNGDGNPYGVAFVPSGFPAGPNIAPGDVLVSNFNSSSSTQGTGTTIVSMSPTGTQSLFATSTQKGWRSPELYRSVVDIPLKVNFCSPAVVCAI